MKMKKFGRLPGLLCLALIFAMLPVTGAYAFLGGSNNSTTNNEKKADSDFEVKIEAGYDGYVKYYRTMPVSIWITNNGQDFEGTAKLIVNRGEYEDNVAYKTEVIIPAGETREVTFLTPAVARYSDAYFYLDNSSGKEVLAHKERININNTDDVYVGILSDDFNSLNYFDQMGTISTNSGSGRPRIFNLADQEFPELERSLDTFDILIINDYDTSQWSDKQYQTLKSWVNNGGILLVGTGASYQKSLGAFQDGFITGKTGNISETEMNFGIHDWVAPVALQMDVLELSVENSSYLEDYRMHLLEIGAGKAVIFDFDLGSSNFSDWEFNQTALYHTFENIIDRYDWNRFETGTQTMDMWMIQDMIPNTFASKIPSIGMFIFLIIFYIILIPVIYVVLKRTDKRHLMWGAIPAAAILFAVIVFFFGSSSRQKKPFVNYAAILTYQGDQVKESTYLAATSPKNKAYGFSINGAYQVTPISDYVYYSSPESTNGEYQISFEQGGEETLIELRDVQAFGKKFFSAERYAEAPGSIEVSLSYSSTGYKGTVTNNTGYDLNNTAFLLTTGTLKLGDIAAGQTIDIGDKADETSVTFINGYGYSIADYIFPYSPDVDYMDQIQLSAKKGMLSNLLDSYYAFLPQEGSFVAFADEYQPELGSVSGYELSGTTLFIQPITSELSADGEFYIPDISDLSEVLEGNFYQSDITWMTSEEGVIEYALGEKQPEMIGLVYQETYYSYDYLETTLYNYDTDTYDDVFDYYGRFSEDMTPYLGEENKIRLHFKTTDPDYATYNNETPIPSISIFGTEISPEDLPTAE